MLLLRTLYLRLWRYQCQIELKCHSALEHNPIRGALDIAKVLYYYRIICNYVTIRCDNVAIKHNKLRGV